MTTETLFRILRPLTVTRTRLITSQNTFSTTYIGFMTIYIFGIPVARVQLTNPW